MDKIKEANIRVCMGLGDIFWVYQKFAPYAETINFRIAQVEGDRKPEVQNRAIPWLKLLPQTGTIDTYFTSYNDYDRLAQGRFSVKEVLQKGGGDYACNKPLEEGIRLDDIDKDYPPLETVPLNLPPNPIADWYYSCLYVCGDTKSPGLQIPVWNTRDWSGFVELMMCKYKLGKRIVIIGASYDRDVGQELSILLKAKGFNVSVETDRPPGEVIAIMKGSNLFMGYQSGLNVFADQVNCRQVMLYYSKLYNMRYTWCKKKNIGLKFHADVFGNSPEKVSLGVKLL